MLPVIVENTRLRERIKELEAENSNLRNWVDHHATEVPRLTAERDQSLASVGAVIEKAASVVPKEHILTGHMIRSIADIQNAIHTINPDATSALNEMLSDAWEEGWNHRNRSGLGPNPYRKETQ